MKIKAFAILVLFNLSMPVLAQTSGDSGRDEITALKNIVALQAARLSALEKKLEGLKTQGDALYFKDQALASHENGNIIWKGSPSGLKGDKGDKGDRGLDGAQGPLGPQGAQGIQGAPGRDGMEICGRMIRIRTGVQDGRGHTWLSLGWGIATTDARADWPYLNNYLECL
ncbi:MAG TPA: collagen-like protein [Oligoflexus sp.]|uniref:collagen-like triple helix repeat-containing protein n=1 Tax=Oligoflexus sp. TaxID=1971216 RepID=UPI002D470FB9|nr:collagen-like protein [Oligoflexus sp.]HYX32906.1 collagen-like protein [Oligoflexus sp.]